MYPIEIVKELHPVGQGKAGKTQGLSKESWAQMDLTSGCVKGTASIRTAWHKLNYHQRRFNFPK